MAAEHQLLAVGLALPWSDETPDVVSAALGAPAGRHVSTLVINGHAASAEDDDFDEGDFDEDGQLVGLDPEVQQAMARGLARIDLGRLRVLALQPLVPPILFSERPDGYHLRFDFFRNTWMVQSERQALPVPQVAASA